MSSRLASYRNARVELRKWRNKSNWLERLNTVANIMNECAIAFWICTLMLILRALSQMPAMCSLWTLEKVPMAICRDCVSRKDVNLMVRSHCLLLTIPIWFAWCLKEIFQRGSVERLNKSLSSLGNNHSCFLNIELCNPVKDASLVCPSAFVQKSRRA